MIYDAVARMSLTVNFTPGLVRNLLREHLYRTLSRYHSNYKQANCRLKFLDVQDISLDLIQLS